MSEEPLVKDGALFFNAPDRKTSKPNVIYYDISTQTTGIEYTKEKTTQKPTTSTTLFKVLMSIGGITVVMSILSVIYLFVVKLRSKKNSEQNEEKDVEVVLSDIDAKIIEEELEKELDEEKDFMHYTFTKYNSQSV